MSFGGIIFIRIQDFDSTDIEKGLQATLKDYNYPDHKTFYVSWWDIDFSIIIHNQYQSNNPRLLNDGIER